MGYEIHEKPDYATLFCHTTDVEFGPRFESLSEAKAFVKWLGCDPRRVEDQLDAQLAIFRAYPNAVTPLNLGAPYAAGAIRVQHAQQPETFRVRFDDTWRFCNVFGGELQMAHRAVEESGGAEQTYPDPELMRWFADLIEADNALMESNGKPQVDGAGLVFELSRHVIETIIRVSENTVECITGDPPLKGELAAAGERAVAYWTDVAARCKAALAAAPSEES